MSRDRQTYLREQAAARRATRLQANPAANAFQKRLASLSKPHPMPGLHLTHQQFQHAVQDDPDGYQAWSHFEHVIILRPDNR